MSLRGALAAQFKAPGQTVPSKPSTQWMTSPSKRTLNDSIEEAEQTQEFPLMDSEPSTQIQIEDSSDSEDSFELRMIDEIRKQTREFLSENGQVIVELQTRKYLRQKDKKVVEKTTQTGAKKRKLAP